jgi:hypothetical protein
LHFGALKETPSLPSRPLPPHARCDCQGEEEANGGSNGHAGTLDKIAMITERLHGHSDAKVPIVRLLRNNALGVVLQM